MPCWYYIENGMIPPISEKSMADRPALELNSELLTDAAKAAARPPLDSSGGTENAGAAGREPSDAAAGDNISSVSHGANGNPADEPLRWGIRSLCHKICQREVELPKWTTPVA